MCHNAGVPELVAAIDAARAEEREACAKIADEYDGDGLNHDGHFSQLGDAMRTMTDIAAAIRAQSKGETT